MEKEVGRSSSWKRVAVEVLIGYKCTTAYVCVSVRMCVCVCVCATMTDIEEVAQHILSQAKMDTHILACIHKSYT